MLLVGVSGRGYSMNSESKLPGVNPGFTSWLHDLEKINISLPHLCNGVDEQYLFCGQWSDSGKLMFSVQY